MYWKPTQEMIRKWNILEKRKKERQNKLRQLIHEFWPFFKIDKIDVERSTFSFKYSDYVSPDKLKKMYPELKVNKKQWFSPKTGSSRGRKALREYAKRKIPGIDLFEDQACFFGHVLFSFELLMLEKDFVISSKRDLTEFGCKKVELTYREIEK